VAAQPSAASVFLSFEVARRGDQTTQPPKIAWLRGELEAKEY